MLAIAGACRYKFEKFGPDRLPKWFGEEMPVEPNDYEIT
jgi:hypothetical protein